MFSSISTAPPKQSASETILVLSGRLNSASLLEDRRAAILGLRSFAKDFPASVASGALRSLIGSLSRDGEDADTLKIVLETLLMLFSPNESSPEASDEVALWLADEFTQRQQNITLLLDLLESNDFFSRLYSLQLLVAILSARPERTEECIFTAPLGISRLVAVLDDVREAIKGEAISLLIYLTPKSPDLQKLVAFENAYERLFTTIDAEGGLTNGGRVVEDCLILMANLLRQNPSNQTLFRESGFMLRLSLLLESSLQQEAEIELAGWVLSQKNRNLYALLALVRLFLVSRAVGTAQNQIAFHQNGLLNSALQLSFNPQTQNQIRAEAMAVCADIIRGNSSLQEGFAQLTVPSPFPPPQPAGTESQAAWPQVYVIDGLLDLTLGLTSLQDFDLRFSACECLKAYFFGHDQIRSHFLGRAIGGYKSGHDETANVLSILLSPTPIDLAASDPYRMWFAATITFHLLYNNPTAKAQGMELTEGEAEHGEEVVTAIQTIMAHLISGLQRSEEPRHLIAYLMLLIAWLYEDLDAVNDFLNEGSNVQGLVQAVIQPRGVDEIVQGLCSMLLGVVYEFSTKDSPIPRPSLHSVLLGRMGQDKFSDRLSRLRAHPSMRDYEVTPQKLDPMSGLLPDVFFDRTFVEFFKDTYSRVSRALDRDPNMEISVISNGVQKGISRELVDSLRHELAEKEKAIEKSRDELASVESALQKEQAEHRKTKDTSSVEVARMKTVNEALQLQNELELKKSATQSQQEIASTRQKLEQAQHKYEDQMRSLAADHAMQLGELRNKIQQLEHENAERLRQAEVTRRDIQADFEQQLNKSKVANDSEVERVKARLEAKIADLNATCSRLEVDLMKSRRDHSQEIQLLKASHQEELKELQAKADEHLDQEKLKTQQVEQEIQSMESRLKEFEAHVKKAKASSEKAEISLKKAETRAQNAEASFQKAEIEVKKSKDLIKNLEQKLEEHKLQVASLDDSKKEVQAELDDLLIVFSDLEEKVSDYKTRLANLGQAVSDAEDDDDDDDEDS
ncbi:Intracellular protein transport protein uso1 [Ceratocystis fimbriata CBS 114723]|uniref:Intracellular protein transport protein uso1 n=1 Tax=Ceratocystis fimbriata CBS 114723 TaxID=1035309 RepID=A0A2C5X0W6_9PEZI|nr:Intracellular protein transport protein uso1 [Ceratocystis fimbriata CBS 114723]